MSFFLIGAVKDCVCVQKFGSRLKYCCSSPLVYASSLMLMPVGMNSVPLGDDVFVRSMIALMQSRLCVSMWNGCGSDPLFDHTNDASMASFSVGK